MFTYLIEYHMRQERSELAREQRTVPNKSNQQQQQPISADYDMPVTDFTTELEIQPARGSLQAGII